MWMEFTPKDWFMVRVELIFRAGDPDPEDAWVRAYLREHQLEPRYQGQEERHDIPCEVLYFGQCYLGQHLHVIQRLYQKGLERSLLLEKLHEIRTSSATAPGDWPLTLDGVEFEPVLLALAEALHEQVKFDTDAEGYLTVHLDLNLVRHELSHLIPTTFPQGVADLSA
jgi:hypothetical protein